MTKPSYHWAVADFADTTTLVVFCSLATLHEKKASERKGGAGRSVGLSAANLDRPCCGGVWCVSPRQQQEGPPDAEAIPCQALQNGVPSFALAVAYSHPLAAVFAPSSPSTRGRCRITGQIVPASGSPQVVARVQAYRCWTNARRSCHPQCETWRFP
jgi:hypothetical protein